MTVHILALETSSSLCGVALLSCRDGQTLLWAREHEATAEHAQRLLPLVDDLLREAGIGQHQLSAVAFGQGPGGFTGLRVACGVAQGMAFALDIPVLPVPSLLAVAARDRSRNGQTGPGASGLAHARAVFGGQRGRQEGLAASESLIRVVAQDARMQEVYLAAYRHNGAWETLHAPLLLGLDDVGLWLDGLDRGNTNGSQPSVRLLGDALQAYPELARLASAGGTQSEPADARDTQEGDAAVACALRRWLEIGPPLRADASSIAWLAFEDWQAGRGMQPDLAAPLYVRDKVAFTVREREAGAGGNPRAHGLAGEPLAEAAEPGGHAAPALRLAPMTAAHLDDVAAIEGAVQSFPWTRGNFADGLKAGYQAWVARNNQQVVGFAMMLLAPDVAHLLVIAVQPDAQNKGAGGLLLRRCEEEAIGRGLQRIMLEVRPSNHNALRFYRARGYAVLATRKDYYPAGHGRREDAYVMSKTLDTA